MIRQRPRYAYALGQYGRARLVALAPPPRRTQNVRINRPIRRQQTGISIGSSRVKFTPEMAFVSDVAKTTAVGLYQGGRLAGKGASHVFRFAKKKYHVWKGQQRRKEINRDFQREMGKPPNKSRFGISVRVIK